MKTAAATISIALCLFLGWLYHFRPDWAAALTLFPAWLWLACWLLALPILKSKYFLVVTLAWLAFLIVEVEETRSLLRVLIPAQDTEQALVVTTINCSGMAAALEDALRESPDVVLVQESPPEEAILALLKDRPGYALLHGIDASILVRGEITAASPTPLFFTAGEAVIQGRYYFIVSLRLLTSNPRVDLWRPSTWREQTDMRQRQQAQIEAIVAELPEDITLIVGGDFNVPQGDKVFFAMEDRLDDSFAQGGRGWCNTILVDVPLLRIDQIWTSPGLVCLNAYTRRSQATDHRLYTASFSEQK